MSTLSGPEIIPHLLSNIDIWGAGMVFTGDRVLDLKVAHVGQHDVVFSACDIFGETTAMAKVALHLFEGLTSSMAVYDFLNDTVHDALVDSYNRDGQTVMVLK